MDFKCAFLNGNLSEEIYKKTPPGYADASNVCKLNKSINGLKQPFREYKTSSFTKI